MFSRKILGLIAAASAFAVACTTFNKTSSIGFTQRNVASVETWKSTPAQMLSSSTLADLSSSGKMNLQNAKLFTDNNRAFQSKLDIIRNAKHDLRLVYYIYSDDYSSSVFTTELIAAARRGVKVELLVDFLTNYDRLDLFTYMESVGQGNLKVQFYGFPTETILRGAVYETVPCSKKGPAKSATECQAEKKALIEQIGNPTSTWFSKIFLTGLYGKNPELVKAAVGIGGQFNPKAVVGALPTPEQRAQLKELARQIYAARLKSDFAAKIKVATALHTHGETLNPLMNELLGALPIANGNLQDWDHLTDYTHHKLILADGEKFQLGGRNIEDSYHTDMIATQIKESVGKYTFMDTDFYGETAGVRNMEAAYDRLFTFSAMVKGLDQVQALVPNEYDVNIFAFKASLMSCLQEGKASMPDLEACVNGKIQSVKGYQTLEARKEAVRSNMEIKSQEFVRKYQVKTDKSWKSGGDALEASDLSSAEAYYLENLTFNKKKPNERIFGSKIGAEAESGKSIHAAWTKALENVCAVSAKTKQNKRVILHSAYLFLPSPLINALGNMMNGKWDCRYVDVTMITNSFQTTDLNIINIFARYQLQALFSYDQSAEKNEVSMAARQNKARFHYYEYAPSAAGGGISLHSKVSVLGDDMIIGSANADVRSYFMDTNNGVYIRNAPQMIADYTKFVDTIIAKKQVVPNTSRYANVTNESLQAENMAILRALLIKYDVKGKVTAKNQEKILGLVNELGGKIKEATQAIISSPATLNSVVPSGNKDALTQKMKDLDDLANRFDLVWKVL